MSSSPTILPINVDVISDSDHKGKVDYILKIIVIGEAGVGKSSFFTRLISNQYRENCSSTIGVDFKAKYLRVGDSVVRLNIFDTSGQERFRSICSNYFHGAHGIFLMYDITDQRSFTELNSWLREIKTYTLFKPVMMLVGNKSDMENFRCVSQEQGKRFGNLLQIPFIETSARDNSEIDRSLRIMVSEIFQKIEPIHLKSHLTTLKPSAIRMGRRHRKRCCI